MRSTESRPIAVVIAAVFVVGCPSSRTLAPEADGGADAGPDAGTRVGRRPTDGGYFYDVFVDPGCEIDGGRTGDASVFLRECEPYDNTGCDPFEACYPSVAYPSGICGEEVFLTFCAPEGARGQGESCGGTLECRRGYACFVTGAGDQCLQLCDLGGGAPSCPRGRICGWTDLPEYGACN